MFIIRKRILFYIISLILIAVSVFSYWNPGIRFGIDFEGGSMTEVSYTNRPDKTVVEKSVLAAGFENTLIQPVGENRYVVRTKELDEAGRTLLVKALSLDDASSSIKIERSNTVGPTVGNELRQKAYLAIVIVLIAIVLFVTYAFRHVSQPVASWKFGLATIIALAHDVIIPTGAFILYAKTHSGEIDMLFVSAILAILGFSVHDTIVVFDRIREHLRLNRGSKNNKESFDVTVGKSVTETFGRSINTSLTIFIVLMVLFFFGPETTRNFTFTLIVGIITGTYSSIFIASPLLVTFEKWQKK